MYISDLNCGWLKHPFFGTMRSIKVDSDHIISKIEESGIIEVYIDTEQGLDIDEASAKKEIDEELKEKIKNSEEPVPEPVRPVSIDEEIFNAKKIKEETVEIIHEVMNEALVGGEIEKGKVDHAVDDIISSVLRNQGALVGLGRLRKIDEYVYYHSMSVSVLSITFGRYLGFDPELVKDLGTAAILHDIGISQIPENILRKTSPLNDDEYEEVKKHVEYGRILLEQNGDIPERSILAAYHHHEKLDGTGYPNGLKGDEISLLGQVMAITDVYDALTTKRSWRGRIEPTEALRMIYEWGGTQFSSELVQKFIRSIGVYPVGSLVRLESGMIGVIISHTSEDLLKPVIRVIYDTNREYVVMPYTVDLSKGPGNGGSDRIIGYEHPEKWNLQPEAYL